MVSANDVRPHGVRRPSLRFLALIASRTAPCGRCEADPPRDRCRQVSGSGHLKSPLAPTSRSLMCGSAYDYKGGTGADPVVDPRRVPAAIS